MSNFEFSLGQGKMRDPLNSYHTTKYKSNRLCPDWSSVVLIANGNNIASKIGSLTF